MMRRGIAIGLAVAIALSPIAATAKTTKAGARCYTTNSQLKADGGFLKCLKVAGAAYRVWTPVTAKGKVLRASVSAPSPTAPDPILADPMTAVAVDPAPVVVAEPAPTPVLVVAPVAAEPPATTTTTEPVSLVVSAPVSAPVAGPSGYAIVSDPNNGGSPEVVYPDPVDSEQPNPSLPAAVPGLTVSNLTENSVDVSYTPIAGVDTYYVYLRYGDSFTGKGGDATNTVVHFTDLSPGWDYTTCVYYRVNGSIESEKSCQAIHTPGTTPHWQNYLDGPTGVVAVAVDNTIEVSWNELPGATRYGVCISSHDAGQCGGYTELDSPRHIRFNDGSVGYPGSQYEVKVFAILTTGEMTVESKVYIVANGTVPPPPVLTTGVTNLRVTDVTPTTVTVAWELPTDHTVNVWSVVARYNTSYQSTGAYPNDTSLTLTGLTPGFGYEIYVEGFDGSNWTTRTSTSVILPAHS